MSTMKRSPHRLGIKYAPLPASPGHISHSFANIEALLKTTSGEWLSHRKVGNNTYLQRTDEGIALILHETAILTWHENDTLTIRNGGWFTMTTSSRLNEWLPFGMQMHSDRGFWYVFIRRNEARYWFHEGMVMDLHTFTEFSSPYDPTADRAWNASVDRKIAAYLRGIKEVDLDQWIPYQGGRYRRSEAPEGGLQSWLLTRLEQNVYDEQILRLTPRGGVWSHNVRSLKRDLRTVFKQHLHRGSKASRFQREPWQRQPF